MAHKRSPIVLGCGVFAVLMFGVVIALLLAAGAAMQTGFLADPDALPAGKIHARQLRQLEEMGVTRGGEKVLFYYSTAFTIRGDGNLFTDQRVISYQETEGILDIDDAAYNEIAEIDFAPSGSWIDDSTITVTKHDGTWFVLYIGTGSKGDALFYNKLMAEWAKHKGQDKSADTANGREP